ncbi:STIV orfB116 family protein [Metallibacterium scheffleri]|nr:DUF1874 domain-containing protein [Metallibacterium scheffleri]
MTLYLLNSPVLTTIGTFRFTPLDVSAARARAACGFTSAIGHAGAASRMGQLLECDVPMQRVDVRMQPGDAALVLRLLRRLPEGRILEHAELAAWPHELALLERVS